MHYHALNVQQKLILYTFSELALEEGPFFQSLKLVLSLLVLLTS